MMTNEEKGRRGFAVIAAKYGTRAAVAIVQRAKANAKRKASGMIESSAQRRDNMYTRDNLREQAKAYFGVDIGAIET
jgi:hypothetical protein